MAMLAKLGGCALGTQVRFASKITTGNMKGKWINGGSGGSLARKYGWKIMPGGVAPAGYVIYHAKIAGTMTAEEDDELPFNYYPGLNTVRTPSGLIMATVDGIVRVAKQPGTEGTAARVFLWVDPNVKDFMTREFERHRHRADGNEFAVDEVEQRFLSVPRWTKVADVEQELPDWPFNPEWNKEPEKRNFDKQPDQKAMKMAKTERQLYEEADHEMFYSRMPNRSRAYSFGGKNYQYKGVEIQEQHFGENYGARKYQRKLFHRPGGHDALHARQHDRKRQIQNHNSTYKVSDMFGTFWEGN
eukprot:TRINITY_DN16639_c0_g1_i1.p2 TRINITY_DN16639_c0_g1~~TRINITY_DN16639_c0_g1_i1.p2  ORF type:complete len:301 (+),score=116.33 TRINITY_DN16639_c0_g1_i1:105-1007(+)